MILGTVTEFDVPTLWLPVDRLNRENISDLSDQTGDDFWHFLCIQTTTVFQSANVAGRWMQGNAMEDQWWGDTCAAQALKSHFTPTASYWGPAVRRGEGEPADQRENQVTHASWRCKFFLYFPLNFKSIWVLSFFLIYLIEGEVFWYLWI